MTISKEQNACQLATNVGLLFEIMKKVLIFERKWDFFGMLDFFGKKNYGALSIQCEKFFYLKEIYYVY